MTIVNCWDLVFCRTCLAKGVKKKIRINRTETCIECRSVPCKKCEKPTVSKRALCFECDKPAAFRKAKASRASRLAEGKTDEN